MSIKLEGRVLLFDAVNVTGNKFSKDCKVTITEKVPLTLEFRPYAPIGYASVIKDNLGIYAKAEIIPNDYISDEDLKNILNDLNDRKKIGVGGFYDRIKRHDEYGIDIIDEATLRSIGLTSYPVCNEYYFEIVEEKK